MVLKGNTGGELLEPLKSEFLENISANDFTLSDAEGYNSGSLNKVSDLLLLTLVTRERQVSRRSYTPLYITRSSLADLIFLQWSLACLNMAVNIEDSLWCFRQKKWFLWVMAEAQAAKNHIYRWGFRMYTGVSTPPLKNTTTLFFAKPPP